MRRSTRACQGLSAEAALAHVGHGGHGVATDLETAMIGLARERLAGARNYSVVASDGQSLGIRESSFDAVLCSLGLMSFRDPARGLSESIASCVLVELPPSR